LVEPVRPVRRVEPLLDAVAASGSSPTQADRVRPSLAAVERRRLAPRVAREADEATLTLADTGESVPGEVADRVEEVVGHIDHVRGALQPAVDLSAAPSVRLYLGHPVRVERQLGDLLDDVVARHRQPVAWAEVLRLDPPALTEQEAVVA